MVIAGEVTAVQKTRDQPSTDLIIRVSHHYPSDHAIREHTSRRILTLVRGTNRPLAIGRIETRRVSVEASSSSLSNGSVQCLTFLLPVNVNWGYPIVVSTWPFREAVRAAWRSVNDHGSSAIDAVVEGCSACEELRCDGTGMNDQND
ncbi:hypothetical protein B296_00021641 [Ensete ventricosum]|uniref:Uncharacterized protein n=1 Tax=Ensete ventricosum TaxID=4639 RepID=A0A426Z2A5_ENSVE|nr:hypothetical protein B296_00021641 [Ensete ventricosum]